MVRRVILAAIVSSTLVGGCGTATVKQGQVEDIMAVPQRGQSDTQRQTDWNERLDRTVSGDAIWVGGIIRASVGRGAFKDGLKDRGYTVADNPASPGRGSS
jgi:hypothetical protein